MTDRTLAFIIGWPVSRSLSPVMHNAAFATLALDWLYLPLPVRPGAGTQAVAVLRALGAGGANVTMPHKQDVVPALDALSGDAGVTAAVNTIVRDGDRLVGHNTDGEGFVRFLRTDAGWDPAGGRALVLGAGGAARAVAVALARAGASVTVAARRPEQAADLARLAPGIRSALWGEPGAYDLSVNATPSREGLPPAGTPLAVDLIYRPPETAFLAAARAGGARTHDGLGMLVHQAGLSFELWTGRDAPLEVMRAAARAALAHER